MNITILVPCYNEEESLEVTILSCLNQSRPFDELVFINDCSTDRTPEILAKYSDRIKWYTTPHNTGNKSTAQEYGMQFVTGDIFVTTDGDTMLDYRFCEEIEKGFRDPSAFAVVGYVKSTPYNWLTLCRAYEYAIGQNIYKLAQSRLSFVFVMPGAASAFRTKTFLEKVNFDHDTITEDLDYTYKMHRHNLKIVFNRNAICYTQDPATLMCYINQVRRWFGGGWQNLRKHYYIAFSKPERALVLTITYTEGVLFSTLLLALPFLNFYLWLSAIVAYIMLSLVFSIYAAYKEKRWSLVLAPFPYVLLFHLNAYIYMEQFVREIIFKRQDMRWLKPKRIAVNYQTRV